MTMQSKPLTGTRLSPQQRHLWALMTELGQGAFTTWAMLRIDGELEPGRLAAAFAATIERHEVLRTTFHALPGMTIPLQVVQPEAKFSLLRPEARQAGEELLLAACREPFDLAAGPVLRAALVSPEPGRHLLGVALPAVASDGPGLINLLREVVDAYGRQDGPPADEGLLQYADIAEWQNEVFEGEGGSVGAQRWSSPDLQEALAAEVVLPGLRTPAAGFSPCVLRVALAAGTADRIAAAARRLAVPEQAVLLAVWQALLGRLAGSDRVVVGVLADGRAYAELGEALGALARHLPIVGRSVPGGSLASRAGEAAEALLEAVRWQEFFDWGRAGEQGVRPPDYAFEWRPEPERWPAGNVSFSVARLASCTDRFALTLVAAGEGGRLRLELRWDASRLSRIDAERLAGRLATLLHHACDDPERPLDESPLDPACERHAALVELNDSAVELTERRTVHALFEEQVDRRPSCPALVCEGEVLTYAELDRRANGVAHRLRELGVGPEVVVALCAERSPELIVGLLGILKAGGAYAPLDPGMPRERLATLVAECGAPLLLTAGLLAGSLPALPRVVRCEDIPPADVRPDGGARGGNLAYVIFTSGSTGLPKGVAVEHRRLVNYVQAAAARLELSPGGRYATVSTLAADLGNTMVFPALTRGGCLHLISHQRAMDPRALAEYAERWDLDYLKIVPSHLSALIGNPWSGGLLPKAAIILGGEALGWDLVARLRAAAPSCRIFNHYGPTEATVGALAHLVGEEETTATVPIGRPLGNARVYLLDPRFLPVPREVAGELYIGGRCLARGYIGRPELTAERFIPDPFAPEAGGRLYRTGDRARLLASGSVEFLGRIDDQVKIRGYRVEPGEVTAVLRAHPAVRDAAVVPHQERPGEVSLVGYVVPAEGSEGRGLKPADLRAFLLGLVPEFMVPRALVLLPSLPLTANGKLDRRRLPAPQDAAGDAQDRIAPRTPAEFLLAAIWRQVLGIGEVGVRDNFFALGGDSILSIQVVSRASQAGLRLTPRQLFQHQTIADLAAVAGTWESLEHAGPLTGGLPLTPIQHWFFAQELPEPQHFNQPLLLRLRPGLDPALLRPAIARLIEHHDALRLRFTRGSGGWEQVCAPPGGEPPWGWIDLRALPAERRRGGQEAAAQQLQESLDLGVRLLRAAVFEWGGAEPPRLALVVHHLAIDAVSWRILLEDLTTACRQAGQGLPIALPSRTTSYGAWAERLREEAGSPARRAELAAWLAIARSDFTLPAAGAGTAGAAASVVVELSAGETRALLSEVPEVYGTQVNDVLLAALAPALARWARHDRPLLELEGHGREASGEGIDLSRTVGWFTSRYPVALELRGLHGPEAVLKSVKEQLRRVPGRGLGFGLLRYLAADPAVADAMTALPRPQVSFNYLGQLDTALPAEALFALAAEPMGPERSPRNPRRYRLEVNVRVAGGRLQGAFVYGRDQHPEAQIEELAGSFLAELRRLIAHCADPRAGGRTPSDFPLAELDQARLDRLVGKGRHLEDVYPLSPLQQGLLFHALYHPGSYVLPMSFTLEGELDVAVLRRAWQEVVDRHPILRTSFAWEGLERPLQLVHRRVELPWEELDWRQLSSGQGEQPLQALLASRLRQGFDLARAPLMSLTLARTGERSWSFLWERHHLLIDGWTTSLILNEVFRAYTAVTGGEPWAAGPPYPFRDYIAWLGAQDLAAAAEHWRRTLAGFAAPTPLPVPPEAALSAPSQEATGEVQVKLSPAESTAVEAFARQRQITLNTLFQGAWALLLAHYADSEDVVFGGVVAGRPPTLPGVDTMAGPFINTLPVRVRVPPASPLVAWLIDLQAAQAEQRQFEHSPLVEIQGWSELPRGLPLFETILVFENYSMEFAAGDGSVRVRGIRHAITNSYALTLRPVPMATLEMHMLFDRSRIPAATATALLQRLELLLARLLAAPESSLGELSAALAAEDERHRQAQEKTYDDSLLQKFKSARRRAVSSTIGGV